MLWYKYVFFFTFLRSVAILRFASSLSYTLRRVMYIMIYL